MRFHCRDERVWLKDDNDDLAECNQARSVPCSEYMKCPRFSISFSARFSSRHDAMLPPEILRMFLLPVSPLVQSKYGHFGVLAVFFTDFWMITAGEERSRARLQHK